MSSAAAAAATVSSSAPSASSSAPFSISANSSSCRGGHKTEAERQASVSRCLFSPVSKGSACCWRCVARAQIHALTTQLPFKTIKNSLTKHYTRLRPLADGNRWNIVQKHTSSESLLYLSVDSARRSDVIALFQWTSGPSRVRKPLYSVLYQIVEWQLAFKGSLRRPKGRWRWGQSSSV